MSVDLIWDELSMPWRSALAEAWASYCDGDLGIGAALVDPASDTVVAVGRNRVNSRSDLARTLSGNFMAHAEMNALAALDRRKADGLHLYTTLQPCLMCAATAVFMHVDTVWFASNDEFFAGVGDLWTHHPYSARNSPAERGPLDSPLATFARLLPLSVQGADAPDGPVANLAAQKIPDIAALAASPEITAALADLRATQAGIEDAVGVVLPMIASSALDEPTI